MGVNSGCQSYRVILLTPLSQQKTAYSECRGRGSNPHGAFAPENLKSSAYADSPPRPDRTRSLDHKRARAMIAHLTARSRASRFKAARDCFILSGAPCGYARPHCMALFNEAQRRERFCGGEGRESNPPATILAAKPVLKTGGATGPLPPPSLDLSTLFLPGLRVDGRFANRVAIGDCTPLSCGAAFIRRCSACRLASRSFLAVERTRTKERLHPCAR